METKERTFLEIIKRFLYPIKDKPFVYFKSAFKKILYSINPIIHVLFIERVIFYVEQNDINKFKYIFLLYIIYVFLFEIISPLLRNWGWVETSDTAWITVAKTYITKFLKLDNTEIEKLWTWKLISIMEKWFST